MGPMTTFLAPQSRIELKVLRPRTKADSQEWLSHNE